MNRFSSPPSHKLPRLPVRSSNGGSAGRVLLEFACWTLGIALIVAYLDASTGLENHRRNGIALFSEARAAALDSHRLEDLSLPGQTSSPSTEQNTDSSSDISDSADDSALPIAVLRIARLDLEVPVYRDISELNLSRGAGWISGTAAPDTDGNMAIAAHRDRYFRPLKDIRIGDTLELESLSGQSQYRVSLIDIVDPEDVSVLDDSTVATLTLVTCYPFYFIGSAPQRYIVQATAVDQPEKATIPEALLAATPLGETP